MKITSDLLQALLRRAKVHARPHGLARPEVFEKASEMLLRAENPPAGIFRLQTTTTKGEGMQVDDNGSTIRSLIYSRG